MALQHAIRMSGSGSAASYLIVEDTAAQGPTITFRSDVPVAQAGLPQAAQDALTAASVATTGAGWYPVEFHFPDGVATGHLFQTSDITSPADAHA